MAKLYFKYGTMGSSKTANALMCRLNYIQKGMNVLVMKPKIDNRHSTSEIVSRIGLSAPCYTFASNENLLNFYEKENSLSKIDVVIVDECQFCSKKQVEQLREIAENLPVLCYGLLTNYKGELFEGSKRLVELSDSISEIKTVCECGRKATMNGRFLGGVLVVEGKEIEIGADEKYKGLCYSCFKKEQQKANVYNKILKYINIFKEKDSVGEWSSDTSMDNIVLHKPHVVYDEDVQAFINDFKEFQIKNPNEAIIVNNSLKDLKKITMKDKSFDYIMTLIAYVLKFEKGTPGLLKALIEEGVLLKWLKQVKKVINQKSI